ncbi:MAG TPA: SDR family NAD(P)-dependent oxidoreductase [Candidatus Binataceae bacterium]|nr:SDR family NAD(P)-dependent oxidoreductase [Candidatus Binataceae bacterium]
MASNNNSKVAVVTGVGAGTGASIARRFAREYSVALIARSPGYLKELGDEIRKNGGRALETPADVGNPQQVKEAFAKIRAELGDPGVLLYNAGSGTWGTIMEISAEQYEDTWRVNSFGAFLCAKEVAPKMIEKGQGVMLFTGATAGVKAGPKSVAFGPAKFAMRGLAQSLSRDLSPRGVHVAWINVDGIIDIPRVRKAYPQLKPEDMLNPDAIADTYWHIAHQDRSAWTMELEVRPFKEKF